MTSAAPSTPSTPSTPSQPSQPSQPGTPTSQPTYSAWQLGAHPLPEDSRGFGIWTGGTPQALRHRLFATKDLLPPPASGGFESSIGPVTPEHRGTWAPKCPVGLADLRYVTVSFRGFDGLAHTGELVVAASEAKGIVSVFRRLFAQGYPIEEMRIVTNADVEAPPTGDGNNTAAFVCRPTTAASSWSAHAYGLAIDVNPFLNPYEKGDLVLPELAASYLDRSNRQAGIVHAGDPVVREFARIGWSWGGAWHSLKDYQHFTATGR